MAVACRTCGHQNPDGSTSCQYCSRSLQPTSIPYYPPPTQVVEASSQPQDQGGYAYPGQGGAYRQAPGANTPGQQHYYAGQYGVQSAPPSVVRVIAMKDPGTGLLLEILPALFGLAGIGWLWAGEIGIGIALLIGYWVFIGIEVLLMFILIGFCLVPFNFIIPIVSAFLLHKRLKERQALAAGVTPF